MASSLSSIYSLDFVSQSLFQVRNLCDGFANLSCSPPDLGISLKTLVIFVTWAWRVSICSTFALMVLVGMPYSSQILFCGHVSHPPHKSTALRSVMILIDFAMSALEHVLEIDHRVRQFYRACDTLDTRIAQSC